MVCKRGKLQSSSTLWPEALVIVNASGQLLIYCSLLIYNVYLGRKQPYEHMTRQQFLGRNNVFFKTASLP